MSSNQVYGKAYHLSKELNYLVEAVSGFQELIPEDGKLNSCFCLFLQKLEEDLKHCDELCLSMLNNKTDRRPCKII